METPEFFVESKHKESGALQEEVLYDDLRHRRVYGADAGRIRPERLDLCHC